MTSALKACSLLIIDDNPDDRVMYRRYLNSRNDVRVTFHEVETGTEGIDAFRELRPDCVLLDFNLPDMTGLEILKELSGTIESEGVPVIMLTGHGNENIAVEAMKLGAQDYLIKGNITADSLRLALQNTIDKVALKRKMRELENVKSDFLSIASHELRTPLTIIREFVSLVNDGITGPVNGEQQECLSTALQNCDRLGNLINDILDIQRIESGNIRLRRMRIGLLDTLRNCHRDFLPQCTKRNISLRLNLPEELPDVLCDPDKTVQILVNLIGNSIKFTPDGGEVTLLAAVDKSAESCISIAVIDNGRGICEVDLAFIWDKFTQVDRQVGPGIKGTGLGLAIVKQLVELQGGQIKAESVPDAGSTFTFTLPIYSEIKEMIVFIEDRMNLASSVDGDLSIGLIKYTDGEDPEDIELKVRTAVRSSEDAMLIIPSRNIILIVANCEAGGKLALQDRIRSAIGDQFEIEIADGIISSGRSITDWLHETKNRLADGKMHVPKRVMIIDDEEVFLDIITETLKNSILDIDITATTDGYQACLRIGELKPDLVILDINMPGFNGEQVLRQLRSDTRWDSVRVMIISGDAHKFEEMKSLGANDFLQKPFGLEDLKTKAESMLTTVSKESILS